MDTQGHGSQQSLVVVGGSVCGHQKLKAWTSAFYLKK